MSIWVLLLILLLTAASVAMFGYGARAADDARRRRYYLWGGACAAGVAAIVALGLGQGRRKRGDRAAPADYINDTFEDPGVAGAPLPPSTADPTALFATQT